MKSALENGKMCWKNKEKLLVQKIKEINCRWWWCKHGKWQNKIANGILLFCSPLPLFKESSRRMHLKN